MFAIPAFLSPVLTDSNSISPYSCVNISHCVRILRVAQSLINVVVEIRNRYEKNIYIKTKHTSLWEK